MAIKGEFPARPPTLAESLNAELDKRNIETKKNVKKAVPQVNTYIADPLPENKPSKIEAHYVLPSECEGIVNMQMAYIGKRKSELIKYIFKSKIFQGFFFGAISVLSYHYIGDYLSEYTFKKGIIEGILSLLKNGFFIDDLIILFFAIMIVIAIAFTIIKFSTGFLDLEMKGVSENFDKYFGCDLNSYASGEDKKIEKFMKEYSFVINYRETPIGFLIVKEEGDEIKILGYSVRIVYTKAEIFKDLLGMMMRKFIIERKKKGVIIEIYNFEKEDLRILKKIGFYKESSCGINLILNFFGVSKDIYKFDAECIEW